VSVVAHQLRYEQLLFWRTREAAFFVFAFPILLLLLLGSVYDGEIEGHTASSWLLVGMLGYGAANTAFAGLAITLVLRREYALLKRIRATPLPAATYLACLLGSNLVVFSLQALALEGVGIVLFDADTPASPVSTLLGLLAGAAAFTGLGLAAAALIRSAEGVSPVVNAIVLPMAFLSGSFGDTDRYPEVLQALAEVLPLSHLIDLLVAVMLEGDEIWSQWRALAVVLAWGAAGFLVALRWFRWAPRQGVT
jgi:ABC-2 type transport system permease protein